MKDLKTIGKIFAILLCAMLCACGCSGSGNKETPPWEDITEATDATEKPNENDGYTVTDESESTERAGETTQEVSVEDTRIHIKEWRKNSVLIPMSEVSPDGYVVMAKGGSRSATGSYYSYLGWAVVDSEGYIVFDKYMNETFTYVESGGYKFVCGFSDNVVSIRTSLYGSEIKHINILTGEELITSKYKWKSSTGCIYIRTITEVGVIDGFIIDTMMEQNLSGDEEFTVIYDTDFKERIRLNGLWACLDASCNGNVFFESSSGEIIRIDKNFKRSNSNEGEAILNKYIHENIAVVDSSIYAIKDGIYSYSNGVESVVAYFSDVNEFKGGQSFYSTKCHDGKICLSIQSSSRTNYYAIMSKEGQVIMSPTTNIAFSAYGLTISDHCYFENGLCPAYDISKKAWGYIDKNGNWAIDAKYEKVSAFCNAYAVVVKSAPDESGLNCYMIDTNGKNLWANN